jgi:glycosyltransferase involved in cell wall biosynthesis
MLQVHHARDEREGIDSRFCAYFEPRAAAGARVGGLGLTGLSCIRTARRRFAAAQPGPEGVVAYHNLWGLPFFADLDASGRRLGVLHSDFPGLAGWLPGLRGLLDAALCVSEPLLDLVRRHLPELDGPRSAFLPYPVACDRTEAAQPGLAGRPLVLGFAGRLAFAQKRVDRFPLLVRELGRAGVDFRLEFLGDGPQGGWLRGQLGDNARVRFHGRQTGPAYWSVVRGWDVMVFVTDYEGLPIALLEGLSVGVLPLFPGVGSGGDRYAAQVRPDLLYPAGDLAAAATAARALVAAPEAEVRELRRRANALAEPHLGEGYERTFAGAVHALTQRPRISRPPVAFRPFHLADHLPFAVVRRLSPDTLWRAVFPRGGRV